MFVSIRMASNGRMKYAGYVKIYREHLSCSLDQMHHHKPLACLTHPLILGTRYTDFQRTGSALVNKVENAVKEPTFLFMFV